MTVFTQAEAVEFEHLALKAVGCSKEEIVGHFIRRYNRLILAQPLALMGHKLLDEGELIAKLHEQEKGNN